MTKKRGALASRVVERADRGFGAALVALPHELNNRLLDAFFATEDGKSASLLRTRPPDDVHGVVLRGPEVGVRARWMRGGGGGDMLQ